MRDENELLDEGRIGGQARLADLTADEGRAELAGAHLRDEDAGGRGDELDLERGIAGVQRGEQARQVHGGGGLHGAD